MAQPSLDRNDARRILPQINELKNSGYQANICRVDESPFDRDEDDGPILLIVEKEVSYVRILLRLLPRKAPFNEGAFKAELLIPNDFPTRPPKLRLLTPIYHPNIGPQGLLCLSILRANDRWTMTTTLFQVVEAAVNLIDNPILDEAISQEIADEYQNRRAIFDGKARATMAANPVSRT